MPIITGKSEVLDLYRKAAQNRWVLPCFCTENLTTTEAILSAVKEYGDEKGLDDLPIIIAITCLYAHRSQASYYTHTRRWDVGLRLFYEDIRVLASKGSPFERLNIMVHLDHVQFDLDSGLLSSDLGIYSSIMYDASAAPFEQNIALTRRFAEGKGRDIVVEGACDEIADASGNEKSELTTGEKAYRYFNETGVDLIVANLGTEHRASAKDLKYYGDHAREIKGKIGARTVLHGLSSVSSDQVRHLFDDGICKANIWTTLERDSSPVLFKDMLENAAKVAGGNFVSKSKADALLGQKCGEEGKASLSHCTTVYRQDIIFNEMKKMVMDYLRMWYV